MLVTFENGAVRLYDCRPLLAEAVFRPLADDAFFQHVRPDPHGYAVLWSDEIDLAESELWLNGKPAEPAPEDRAAVARKPGKAPTTR